MKRVSNCCWWTVAAVAVVGLVLAPLSAQADLPDTVTHNGKVYKVVKVSGAQKISKKDMRQEISATGEGSASLAPAIPASPLPGSRVALPRQSQADGLRDSVATYTFFSQTSDRYWGEEARSWGDDYYFVLPSGKAAVVTEIVIGGIWNYGAAATYNDVAVLVEAYDTYNEPGDPVHSEYMGGAVLYIGTATLNTGYGWGDLEFIASEEGLPYFFQASNDGDNHLFVSIVIGSIVGGTGGVGGTFVPEPQDGRLVMSFDVGEAYAPTIGDAGDGFYLDAGDGTTDRIYNVAGHGYMGGDYSYLDVVFRGEAFTDCNDDSVLDDKQVECGLSLGSPACETGTCAYFTTGGQFQDPLGIGWVVDASCDVDPVNGKPDECDDEDCNGNGIGDGTDIALGTSEDCNDNTVPDECEIDENSTAPGGPFFCTEDCDPDCNNDGIPDDCQLSRPGVCDTGEGICDDGVTECDGDEDCPAISTDCDANFIPDECQIADDPSIDCDANGVPDFCEYNTTDCNGNGIIDACDILNGVVSDSNENGVPDVCDYFSFCWIIWNDFSDTEGYALGTVIDQPAAETDPVMKWSHNDGGAGVFDIVSWADACNLDGYALKIQGNSSDDRITSPLYGTAADIDEDYNWQVLTFSYMVSNGTTNDATQVVVTDDEGNEVTWLEFGIYDFADEGDPADPRPTIAVFDADGAWIIDNSQLPSNPKAFTWTAGLCDSMQIWLINDSGSVNPPYLGFTFSDEETIWIFGASEGGGEFMARFENTLNWSPTWTAGTVGQTHDFYMDNVQLCVIGPDAPFSDCNGNGIADEMDIAQGGADCNNNGILDACDILEGLIDCDMNGLLDECDIAANSSLDGNGNDILDFCEPSIVYASTVGFEAIEGFVVDQAIDGQLGWWGATFGETPATVNVVYQGGSQQVKFDPNAPGSHASAFGSPLYVDDETPDDVMQWNFQVTFGAGTNYEGDTLFVDLTDFYDEIYGGEAPNPNFTLDRPTTGLLFVRTGESPSFVYSIYTYDATGDTFDTGLTWAFNQTIKFKVKLENTRKHVVITKVGSGSYTVDVAGGSPLQSGDRHVRHIGFVSNPPTMEKLIDKVYRKHGLDCDYDGVIDSEAITSGLVADLNADGIPDRCQDCDNDCTWISGKPSLGPVNTACLDPREIALSTAADANLNGIPDACDIDVAGQLPYIGWETHIQNIGGNDLTCEQVFHEVGFDPAEECYVTRQGGGGWSDCENFGAGDGVLDSINICGTPADPECVANTLADCNENGFADGCDIVSAGQTVPGTYDLDKDGDGMLDSCADCNGNSIADYDDINVSFLSTDVIINATGAAGSDGIPDECCVEYCGISDLNCDLNADLMDYAFMQSCQGDVAGGGPLCGCADMNGDGVIDGEDVVLLSFFLYGPL
ncbi:MAG: hypothetical protein JXB13_01385 [Phycisphaerae bacterium]|nr:hypothetical protein [Phycisphaerae bacterium]